MALAPHPPHPGSQLLALAMPVVGLLYLDNYRDNLIQAELER